MLQALESLRHAHQFDTRNPLAERNTRWVLWITLACMVVEIAAGWWFNSMALLADGWHMSSHALAIGLTAFAYAYARTNAHDARFAFGTWKVEVLGSFASALLLLVVAALMVWGSVERLLAPQPIHYQQAIAVAVLGLAVNLVCALILGQAHHGHDHHHHDHHHHHHGEDLNLRSAYVHVLADAATSVLAIAALLGGMVRGWSWLDPAMGVVGAVLVAVWAKGLLIDTGRVLLDREMDHPVVDEIREVVEVADAQGHTRIADLHVWRVGKSAYSCALSVVTTDPGLTPQQVRDRIGVHEEVVHATIELHHVPPTRA
ncbi:CDF family Co(II)/Ni(II) efflux transporter DmeF [Curvibacter sp. APW13]|uniref:CDF family Co(II)/Ni(II) efflux transporter DmeF n=1 Tax=Curvibacter sp. APW13 TaxID=3077236 RepID=UPI0028DFCDC4|nr:CDF family Co(II)/Ni(II) efflux transporter DmeF [Curvibacter sp. APW13]MDT8990637.1 CDF family Co(II)/Ni(II) efflux transporter DmeF [Curvibacter sp. APW13]